MTPGIAEDLDHQVRCAVDDRGLFAEVGRGVDHAKQFHYVGYAVERTEMVTHSREQAQAAAASCVVTLIDIEGIANLAPY